MGILKRLLGKKGAEKAVITSPTTQAVRIIIAYNGDTCPQAKDITTIVNSVWDGRLANNARITAYPIAEHNWSSDRELAVAWKALLLVLEHRDSEHAYWKDHRRKALLGRIAETGQRFYVEVYYR